MISYQKLKYLYLLLIFSIIFIWFVILSLPDNKLHIYTCDVGQGDGFLISYGVNQIVIDGGPNNNITKCVSSHMPFWDNKIEMVVSTHPDRDHYYGLISLVSKYEVDTFVATPVKKDPPGDYQKLVDLVESKKIKMINPYSGDVLKISDLSFDIVWPNLDKFGSELKTEATFNSLDASGGDNLVGIAFTLHFKDFSELFTADLEFNNLPEVLETYKIDKVNILKLPHHGSKNGLNEALILASSPEIGIISAGLNNQFGHPNQEILDLMAKYNIKIYRTDQQGEIEVVSDGKSYKVIP